MGKDTIDALPDILQPNPYAAERRAERLKNKQTMWETKCPLETGFMEYVRETLTTYLVRFSKQYRDDPEAPWKPAFRARKFVVRADSKEAALVLARHHQACPPIEKVVDQQECYRNGKTVIREYQWTHHSTERMWQTVFPV